MNDDPRKGAGDPASAPGANLPGKWSLRFLLGFLVAGSVAFVGVALWSSSWSILLSRAPLAGLLVGLIGGLISAFGKKAFAYVLAFAREVIFNP